MGKSMNGVVKSMSKVMATMKPEKFEDLDVSSKVMASSMESTTAGTMPESQVDQLMQQVADEHGLEFESAIEDTGMGVPSKKLDSKEEKKESKMSEEDLLEARLKGL